MFQDHSEKIESTPEEKQREKETNRLWDLKDELVKQVPTKIIKGVLEANQMEVNKVFGLVNLVVNLIKFPFKVTPVRLVHKMADGSGTNLFHLF